MRGLRKTFHILVAVSATLFALTAGSRNELQRINTEIEKIAQINDLAFALSEPFTVSNHDVSLLLAGDTYEPVKGIDKLNEQLKAIVFTGQSNRMPACVRVRYITWPDAMEDRDLERASLTGGYSASIPNNKLSAFKQRWNFLNQASGHRLLLDTLADDTPLIPYIFGSGIPVPAIEPICGPTFEEPVSVMISRGIKAEDENLLRLRIKAVSPRELDTPDELVDTFTIRSQSVRFNAQLEIASRVGVESGSFEESFPAVSRLTTGAESITIPELRQLIGSILRRSPDTVTVLGLDIQESILSRWALLLLITAQLTFLVELNNARRYQRYMHSVVDVPWVGAYRDLVSMALYCGGIWALPVLAVFASLRALSDGWPSLSHGAMGLLAISLATLTLGIELKRKWPRPIGRFLR